MAVELKVQKKASSKNNVLRLVFLSFIILLFLFGTGVSFAAGCGTLPSGVSSFVASCYPVNIINSQTRATSSGLQVKLSSYPVNALAGNTFVYNSVSGMQMPAWVESNGIVWVNLGANTIAASSSANSIYYVAVGGSGTNFFTSGNNIGEAPQLSGSNTATGYGTYDNGASVFTQYGGKSWASFTPENGVWLTSNGFLQQTSNTAGSTTNGGAAEVITGASYSATGNYILEQAFNYSNNAVARVGILAVGTVGTQNDVYAYRFIGQQNNNGAGFLSFLNDQVVWVVNNAYQGAMNTAYTMSVTDAAGTWSGNLISGYNTGGAVLTSLAATAYSTANKQSATTGYVGISASWYNGANTVANPLDVQWFRMRTYPPNGVMPTVNYLAAISHPYSPSTTGATIDNGRSNTIIASWLGGVANFAITLFSGSSSTCSSDTTVANTASSVAGQSTTFVVSPTSNTYYCIGVKDANAGVANQVTANQIVVNPVLSITSVWSSNNIADQLQYETITGSWTGGTSPFTANFYITNTINGNVIANSLTSATSPATFTFQVPQTNNALGAPLITFTVADQSG